ncbi:MAG: hypothetical protein DLM63_05535 [Solirubrobacterales bacterium]|nr:MAG: hypothetical protein DLM63_05535 [Solirubrobacterales bacterium]
MHSGKLLIAAATTAVFAVAYGGLAAGPAAAEPCDLTVTLLGGVVLHLTVDVPPGTPATAITIPGVPSGTIASISESCQSTTTTTPTTTSSPATATVPATPQSGSNPSTPAAKHGGPQARPGGTQSASSNATTAPSALASVSTSALAPAPGAPAVVVPGGLRAAGGAPLASDPTLSLALPALPGAAGLGVPDFFVSDFRIPPFLLPIYQAAGVAYGVPWQVLAAINEIETDYGRNLSVSSAGALGWMQFLPATWKQYGVDATGNGRADPYNPVDAIFAAARYLKAAGAATNLRGAVFAYNHASWYVDSVLLRAKLIGGMPDALVGALTGLTQGHFPVAAPSRYADDMREAHAPGAAKVSDTVLPRRNAINIFARTGAPVIAVQDGTVTHIGVSRSLGRYVVLRDGWGNSYTYGDLGSLAAQYPVPKPPAPVLLATTSPTQPTDAPPAAPATAGEHALAPTTLTGTLAGITPGLSALRERLFAYPARPNAYRAGGAQQIVAQSSPPASLAGFVSRVLNLPASQIDLKPLRAGAQVVAGTLLGRTGAAVPGMAPHLRFEIRPAGVGEPLIDPKPVLDGWKLLEASAVYRAAGQNPLVNSDVSIGQVLLASKSQLQRRVLADPRIGLSRCHRRDVLGGQVDQRVLATLEYLSLSGLRPALASSCVSQAPSSLAANPAAVTPTKPSSSPTAVTNTVLALSDPTPAADTFDLTAINGIPILGHQGPGSVTDLTIRRLLALQGAIKPHMITSLMRFRNSDNTTALPAYANRIHIAFLQLAASTPAQQAALYQTLQPHQWLQLINRLNQLAQPSVTTTPSSAAIAAHGG